jgi:hypothetical protein
MAIASRAGEAESNEMTPQRFFTLWRATACTDRKPMALSIYVYAACLPGHSRDIDSPLIRAWAISPIACTL